MKYKIFKKIINKEEMRTHLLMVFLFMIIVSCKKTEKSSVVDNEQTATEVNVAVDADTLSIVAWRSGIAWRGYALNKSHTGKIKVDSGYVVLAKDKKILGGDFYLDMTSINVVDLKGDDKLQLENHLKGLTKGKEDHFFNVNEFPTAKFSIVDSFEEEGKTYLEGNLTMKGIENEVEAFPIELVNKDGKFSMQSSNFDINRTYWGINYASSSFFENLKDEAIKDYMSVKITVFFNLK